MVTGMIIVGVVIVVIVATYLLAKGEASTLVDWVEGIFTFFQ